MNTVQNAVAKPTEACSTRNVVLCFDGTSNTFGETRTNVARLVQALERDPARQVIYYDPGVGTLPEPGYATGFGKRFSELIGLAFGSGLTGKVETAYQFLMETWRPGDRLYIFGFSRGAYSARVLAAMLHAFGLLPPGNTNLVPHVMKLFSSVRGASRANTKYWDQVDSFRETFARDSGAESNRIETYHLGLWDTVSSVGWIWDQLSFPHTFLNPSVHSHRHAISIDERRCFFRQNRFSAESRDLKEYWFAGSHGDIGGGYRECDPPAWRNSFDWIADEASQQGLLVHAARLANVLEKSSTHPDHWSDEIHDQLQLQWAWWIPEFVPRLVYSSRTKSRTIRVGLGRPRTMLSKDMIHHSALLRIRGTAYRPPNFSPAFIDTILGLPEVPEALAYPEQPA